MRKITKSEAPPALVAWIRDNPTATEYERLDNTVRREIRRACARDQFFLCAYCCKELKHTDGDERDCHNEHVEAKDLAHHRELEYANIVASCDTPRQCGKAHDNQVLPLTPLMGECESELRFYLDGSVQGTTHRARTSINVLNLGANRRANKNLVERRKNIFCAMLAAEGFPPDDLEEEDGELLEAFLEDLMRPNQGKLPPYSPALANFLRDWLRRSNAKD